MSDFTVTVDANRAAKFIKQLNTDKIHKFMEVVGRAYKKKPDKKDLEELRKWIKEYPDLWRAIFDIAWLMEDNFIRNMVQDEVALMAMQKNTAEIREGFDYSGSTVLERMLIDNIIISWLGVQHANFQLVSRMNREERIVILDFWEKRVSAAQRRYLRACESLMRIRRLMSLNPGIQINIAANGGQQVNVAGNIVKK